MKKKEKEEERVERIIRSLLKLPENRRCINCNSLGPQYVCTTFLTFVCTNCSGVHREFTHRVKSVSMAKFKAEEVSALQAGGNDRARQIYFKDWDPQRDSYPDGSNLHKLRDFIRHVYVDRKYTGERSSERFPRLRLNDKEESYESRKIGLYYSRSKSPSYRDKYERSEQSRPRPGGRSDDRSLKYYYDERRSPCYGEENSRSGGFKKGPVRFEIVDDRIRDEKPRSGKQSDNRRFPHRESRYGSLSPDYQKNMDRSRSPVVRPVKDILGENAPTLHVGEHSKATDRKDADSSADNQMIKSSGSKGSINVMAVEDKSQNLIDFDTDCTSSNAVAAPQKEENQQSSDGCNCNSKESSAKQNAPPGPKPNTLEFLLLELSVPSVEPAASVSEESKNDSSPSTTSGGHMLTSVGLLMLTFPDNNGASKNDPGGNVPVGGVSSAAPPGQLLALTSGSDVSATASGDSAPDAVHVEQTLSLLDTFDSTASATSLPLQPSNGSPSQAVPDVHGDSTFKMPNGLRVSNVQQHQLSAVPAADGRPSGQQTSITKVAGLNNQPQTSMHLPNAQDPSAAQHSSQDVANIIQDCTSGIKSQHVPLATESIGRKELPMDLFTACYSPLPGSIPGWQNALPYGTGYNMQYYPNSVPARQYPNQAISSNPFDLDNETTSLQVSPFAGVTNASNTGALVPISSIDTNSSGFMASQAPAYASVMPLWSSSFRPATSSGAYMGQQLLHMNTPSSSRPQGDANGFGSEDPFSSLNIIQQSSSAFPLPSARSSLPSMGGNPFV